MRNMKKRLNNKKKGGAFEWIFGKKEPSNRSIEDPNRSIEENHKNHKNRSSIEGVSKEEADGLLKSQARKNAAWQLNNARREESKGLPPPMNPMYTKPPTGGKKKRKSMKLKKKSMRTRKGKGVKSRKYKK